MTACRDTHHTVYLHAHTCSDMRHTYAPNVCAHSHGHIYMHTCFVIVLPISTSYQHTCAHVLTRLLHTPMTISHLSGQSYQIYHTTSHLYVWLKVCSLPLEDQRTVQLALRRPLPSMPSTMLIRSGSMLETCHFSVPWWTHYFCQEEGCWWLMGIVTRC